MMLFSVIWQRLMACHPCQFTVYIPEKSFKFWQIQTNDKHFKPLLIKYLTVKKMTATKSWVVDNLKLIVSKSPQQWEQSRWTPRVMSPQNRPTHRKCAPCPDSKSRSSMLASFMFVFESLLGMWIASVQAPLQNMACPEKKKKTCKNSCC